MFKKKFCFHCKKSFRVKKMWEYYKYGHPMYVCSSCAPTHDEANNIFTKAMENLNNEVIKDFKESWKQNQKVDEFKW